ncbi:hypothetical protein ACT4ZD_07105 [Acinetobacter baumannii]
MNKNPIDKLDIPDNRYGHVGELEMRSRLPSPIYRWDKYSLDSMIQREIASGMSRFISAQKFFLSELLIVRAIVMRPFSAP